MSIIDTLITNRTGGYYNASDLNRVGEAVQYLADLLTGYDYPVTVNPKTDWSDDGENPDIPTTEQMAAYLSDVLAIKVRFYGTTEIPDAMGNIDYEDANNIERLLVEIEALIDSMAGTFLYSGGFYSGTDPQIQLLTGEI